MRKFRLFLTMFFAAAMLNWLIAWACILWSPYIRHTEPSEQRAADGWPATIAGLYGQQGWWFTGWGFGVWESVPSGARGSEGGFLYWRGSATPAYYRGGWPMLSVQSTVTFHDYLTQWDLPIGEIFHRGIQTGWLPAWMHAHDGRRLPLVPLWLGFAANTLLFFGILLAIRVVWLRIRRRMPNFYLTSAVNRQSRWFEISPVSHNF